MPKKSARAATAATSAPQPTPTAPAGIPPGIVIHEGIAELPFLGRGPYNILDREHLLALERAFDWLADGPRAKVVILHPAGDKGFTAGADIAQMVGMDKRAAAAYSTLGQRVAFKIESFPGPVIAVIDGFCLGGGVELVLAADLRIASPMASFGQPEINIGIIPGWGATQRLSRLIGIARAKDVIYTGRKVPAEEALQLGLVNAIAPRDRLMAKARELAGTIAGKGEVALAAAKRVVNVGIEIPLDRGLEIEREIWADLFETEDQKEGMRAFLERRPAAFTSRLTDHLPGHPLPRLPKVPEESDVRAPGAAGETAKYLGELATWWVRASVDVQQAQQRAIEAWTRNATTMLAPPSSGDGTHPPSPPA